MILTARVRRAALLLGASALLALDAHSHGGQYVPPGDVVPPAPGGGRGTPTTPTPGGGSPTTPGPTTPGPTQPAGATPGPATPGSGPAGGRGGATTPGRGIVLDDDVTRWDFWWEFNKDPFLRLKDAIHSSVVTSSDEFWLGLRANEANGRDLLEPTAHQKVFEILPALKKALDTTAQRDITSACMIAMAKVGANHPDFTLREVIAPRLQSRDQEVRETAALALGIAAQPDAATLQLLTDLAGDTAAGRAACARSEVDERTRSFACYSLGLIANAHTDDPIDRAVFDAVEPLLATDAPSRRNLQIAAVHAIGLLGIDVTSGAGQSLHADAVACLLDFYRRRLGVGEQIAQAHCPTALARLLQGPGVPAAAVAAAKQLFAAELAGKDDKRASHDLARSCALALGQLASPIDDEDSPDHAIGTLLLDAWRGHKDAQTRNFSILALGRIGGRWTRTQLLIAFDRASSSLEKPWVAMAMGCHAFERAAAQRDRTAAIDPEFGAALQGALRDTKDPQAASAFAVALGLVRHHAALDDMRALLHKSRNKDDLAGYLCIGLALLGDRSVQDDVRALLRTSLRRPDLLRQAAVALGKLGDKSVADELLHHLDAREPTLATLSAVASALGFIGDRRTIAPLVQMLFDDRLGDLSRAFAAVALGGVGDKEPLPWNAKIKLDLNYRAAVETLTDRSAGILDIL